jgi:hypothetical protein
MGVRTSLSKFLRKTYSIPNNQKAYIHQILHNPTPVFIIYTINYNPSLSITESRWKRSKVFSIVKSKQTLRIWKSFVPPEQSIELDLRDIKTTPLKNLDYFKGPVPNNSLIFRIDLSGDYIGTN